MIGIMTRENALKLAMERDLDLIETVSKADPPVCKIGNLGRHRYEIKKQQKEQKKKLKPVSTKEVYFRPGIETHDFNTKINLAKKFLISGNKVKLSIKFRPRELRYKSKGTEMLKQIVISLEDISKIEVEIREEARQIFVILGPDKKKIGTDIKSKPTQPSDNNTG